VAHLTDERLVVPNAEIVLVYPISGGGGAAHLIYNSVCIEAVQTDPIPELPEVLRLCWLLSQLNIDLPIFSETIHRDRWPLVAALGMLPATLAANQGIQTYHLELDTIRMALEAWQLDGSREGNLAELLLQWWETCLDSQLGWGVALAGLDRMLA
jgi:hypothetical protein